MWLICIFIFIEILKEMMSYHNKNDFIVNHLDKDPDNL